jgi:hypothetical protein
LLASRSLVVRSLRAGFPVTIAAILLAAAVPAQAQSLRGWRIAQVVGPSGGNGALVSTSASGPSDVWAAGDTCAPWPGSCSPKLLVTRWNGHTWTAQRLPRSLRRRFGSMSATAVGAASSNNAWVFGQRGFSAAALHWNGRTWAGSGFPSRTAITQTAVFSARNAWAFGDRYNARYSARKIYAARYNGTKWQPVSLPGEPTSLTVLSAKDMWAVGISASTFRNPQGIPAYIAMHWNGHRWQSYPLPTLGLQAPEFLDAASSAATGPTNLWVEYAPDELAYPAARPDAAAAPPAFGLLHWNGASWSEIATPYTVPSGVMAADGHGGLWIYQRASGPSFVSYLYHYSHGTWTSQALPIPRSDRGQILAMTHVPGTASLWAVGSIGRQDQVDSQAVIFRFRR